MVPTLLYKQTEHSIQNEIIHLIGGGLVVGGGSPRSAEVIWGWENKVPNDTSFFFFIASAIHKLSQLSMCAYGSC